MGVKRYCTKLNWQSNAYRQMNFCESFEIENRVTNDTLTASVSLRLTRLLGSIGVEPEKSVFIGTCLFSTVPEPIGCILCGANGESMVSAEIDSTRI